MLAVPSHVLLGAIVHPRAKEETKNKNNIFNSLTRRRKKCAYGVFVICFVCLCSVIVDFSLSMEGDLMVAA
jgi:hypothetical protein